MTSTNLTSVNSSNSSSLTLNNEKVQLINEIDALTELIKVHKQGQPGLRHRQPLTGNATAMNKRTTVGLPSKQLLSKVRPDLKISAIATSTTGTPPGPHVKRVPRLEKARAGMSECFLQQKSVEKKMDAGISCDCDISSDSKLSQNTVQARPFISPDIKGTNAQSYLNKLQEMKCLVDSIENKRKSAAKLRKRNRKCKPKVANFIKNSATSETHPEHSNFADKTEKTVSNFGLEKDLTNDLFKVPTSDCSEGVMCDSTQQFIRCRYKIITKVELKPNLLQGQIVRFVSEKYQLNPEGKHAEPCGSICTSVEGDSTTIESCGMVNKIHQQKIVQVHRDILSDVENEDVVEEVIVHCSNLPISLSQEPVQSTAVSSPINTLDIQCHVIKDNIDYCTADGRSKLERPPLPEKKILADEKVKGKIGDSEEWKARLNAILARREQLEKELQDILDQSHHPYMSNPECQSIKRSGVHNFASATHVDVNSSRTMGVRRSANRSRGVKDGTHYAQQPMCVRRHKLIRTANVLPNTSGRHHKGTMQQVFNQNQLQTPQRCMQRRRSLKARNRGSPSSVSTWGESSLCWNYASKRYIANDVMQRWQHHRGGRYQGRGRGYSVGRAHYQTIRKNRYWPSLAGYSQWSPRKRVYSGQGAQHPGLKKRRHSTGGMSAHGTSRALTRSRDKLVLLGGTAFRATATRLQRVGGSIRRVQSTSPDSSHARISAKQRMPSEYAVGRYYRWRRASRVSSSPLQLHFRQLKSAGSRPWAVSSSRRLASHFVWRSIATAASAARSKKKRELTRKFCLFYNRFGRCRRGENCQYIHDPDKVAVCTRFLRGTCQMTNCLFSHHVAPDKMPTCVHFLRGACTRDNCPYSHVNVGRHASTCAAFLQGHCPRGNKCKLIHVRASRDKTGKLARRGVHKPGPPTRQAAGPPTRQAAECATSLPPTASHRSDGGAAGCEAHPPDTDDVSLPWRERQLPPYIGVHTTPPTDTSPGEELQIRPKFSVLH